MKPLALLALPVLLTLGARAVQDEYEAARPLEQHAWLRQLAGEWTSTVEASMGPDAEPMTMEITESVRAIGDLWIVAEGRGTVGGAPMTTIMTLGYDPAQEAFVGTWIDSAQTQMWIYRGRLDAARKVLTLDTDGPAMDDPTQTAHYRDAIELVGPDHKRLTSSVQSADGTWTTFLTADYRRKK